MELQNIVFYYPSKITGGAEYLFVRCAKAIIQNYKYNVYYVDYLDGFARKELANTDVKFINYIEGSSVQVPENTVVIFQLNMIGSYREVVDISDNIRPMFWCLHFLNIHYQINYKGFYFLSPISRFRLGKAIKYLSEIGVIKYLGMLGYVEIGKELYIQPTVVSCIPLPVPIDISKGYKVVEKEFSLVRCCWLGRLDKEKSLNIMTYMNELEEINKSLNVTLSIIGLGSEEDNLKKYSDRLSYPVHFIGEKRGNDLDAYIKNNVDIGFASGTSALEFSMRGVPSIQEWIIDRVYDANVRTTYTYPFQVPMLQGSRKKKLVNKYEDSFRNKFFYAITHYKEIQEQCYAHVCKKSPQNTAKLLVDTLECISNLDAEDYQKHLALCYSLISKAKRRKKLLYKIKKLVEN